MHIFFSSCYGERGKTVTWQMANELLARNAPVLITTRRSFIMGGGSERIDSQDTQSHAAPTSDAAPEGADSNENSDSDDEGGSSDDDEDDPEPPCQPILFPANGLDGRQQQFAYPLPFDILKPQLPHNPLPMDLISNHDPMLPVKHFALFVLFCCICWWGYALSWESFIAGLSAYIVYRVI